MPFLILSKKTTPPWMVSQKFCEMFQNSCFKQHFRSATTGIMLGQAKAKGLLKIRK